MDLIRNSARTRGKINTTRGARVIFSTTCSNTAACGWVNKYQKRRGGWRGGQADDPAWCANLVGVPGPLAFAPDPRSTSTRSVSVLSPFHWLAAEGKERMGFSIHKPLLCMSPFASLSLSVCRMFVDCAGSTVFQQRAPLFLSPCCTSCRRQKVFFLARRMRNTHPQGMLTDERH